jgi:hypothetical protein
MDKESTAEQGMEKRRQTKKKNPEGRIIDCSRQSK